MGRWLAHLMPDAYVASIYDIPLDELYAAGRRLILTDLDNTLVPWNDPDAPDELYRWLARARDIGFDVCILSNNRGPRVALFAETLGVAAIGKARKPRPQAFRDAMDQFGSRPEEAVMVGDQLLTDIRGGRRLGLYTILVLPIAPKEWWGTRIVRRVERLAMQQLVHRYGLVIPKRR